MELALLLLAPVPVSCFVTAAPDNATVSETSVAAIPIAVPIVCVINASFFTRAEPLRAHRCEINADPTGKLVGRTGTNSVLIRT